jgi:methyltransferase-like protein/SAM-dependent methyltransferase
MVSNPTQPTTAAAAARENLMLVTPRPSKKEPKTARACGPTKKAAGILPTSARRVKGNPRLEVISFAIYQDAAVTCPKRNNILQVLAIRNLGGPDNLLSGSRRDKRALSGVNCPQVPLLLLRNTDNKLSVPPKTSCRPLHNVVALRASRRENGQTISLPDRRDWIVRQIPGILLEGFRLGSAFIDPGDCAHPNRPVGAVSQRRPASHPAATARMSTQPALAISYDEVPFPSQSLPQTHPDRLAAVATLFGMRPAPIDRCRVLELACASGANLVPMADRHPESSFVGVDFSGRQIAAAKQFADELHLGNIELAQLNIVEIDDSWGQFDYIIAHGLFSWVARPVQERLLAICKSHLAPQGVAYVSYNIYPGWHLRSICRDMMCTATPSTSPARHRVAEGRKLLEFFSRSLAVGDAPYCRVLKADIDAILGQHDNFLLHDFFEEENHPLYFHEFVQRAAGHGLQYLGDATPATMYATRYGPAVEQHLLRVSSDVVSMEQHLDLLRNRAFRQTLLCHDGVGVVRRLDVDQFARLFFVGQVRPKSPQCEIASSAVESFETPAGAVVSSPSPAFKSALAHLGRAWPLAVSFEALAETAASHLDLPRDNPSRLSDADRYALVHNLMQCAATGVIELQSAGDEFIAQVTDKPRASRLARLQSHATRRITNRRHEPVLLDELTQNLLRHLDGEHDRKALLQLLIEAVDRGELSILVNGIPASRGSSAIAIIETTLDECLAKLASSALLVA